MAISGLPENPMADSGAPRPIQHHHSPIFTCHVQRPLEQQGQLRVPHMFMTLYGYSLGEDVALIDVTRNCWDAKLREIGGEWWLTEMCELGQHHSVQVGEVLIFRLIGDSQLHVTIMDREGVSRE